MNPQPTFAGSCFPSSPLTIRLSSIAGLPSQGAPASPSYHTARGLYERSEVQRSSRRVIYAATVRGASPPGLVPSGEEVHRKLTGELRKTRELNPHYYESRLSFQDSATNQHPPIFRVVGLTQPRAHRHSHHPAGSFTLHRGVSVGLSTGSNIQWDQPGCNFPAAWGALRGYSEHAEAERFELPVGFPTQPFQGCTIGHSDTLPKDVDCCDCLDPTPVAEAPWDTRRFAVRDSPAAVCSVAQLPGRRTA